MCQKLYILIKIGISCLGTFRMSRAGSQIIRSNYNSGHSAHCQPKLPCLHLPRELLGRKGILTMNGEIKRYWGNCDDQSLNRLGDSIFSEKIGLVFNKNSFMYLRTEVRPVTTIYNKTRKLINTSLQENYIRHPHNPCCMHQITHRP